MKIFSWLLLAVAFVFGFSDRVFGQGCDCGSDTVAPKISLVNSPNWFSPPYFFNFKIENGVVNIFTCDPTNLPISFSKDDVFVSDNCTAKPNVEILATGFQVFGGTFYELPMSNQLATLTYRAMDNCGNSSVLTLKFRRSPPLEGSFIEKLSLELGLEFPNQARSGAEYFVCNQTQIDAIQALDAYQVCGNGTTKKSKGTLQNRPAGDCETIGFFWEGGFNSFSEAQSDTFYLFLKKRMLASPISIDLNPNRAWKNDVFLQGNQILKKDCFQDLTIEKSDFIITGACDDTEILDTRFFVDDFEILNNSFQTGSLQQCLDQLLLRIEVSDGCGSFEQKTFVFKSSFQTNFIEFTCLINGQKPVADGTYFVCDTNFVNNLGDDYCTLFTNENCNTSTKKSKTLGANKLLAASTCRDFLVSWEISHCNGVSFSPSLKIIEDNEAPQILIQNPIKSITSTQNLPFDQPTISDNCIQPVVLQNDVITTRGDTTFFTRTWTARDSCQSTSASQILVFVRPKISNDCPQNQSVELPAGAAAAPINWQFPTAISACDGSTIQPCNPLTINSFQSLGRRGNSLFYLSNFRKNWADAQAICRAQGGNLASIQSFEENQFLAQAIGKQEAAWIGFSDEKQEGKFEWADGSPVNFTNWAIGEPNNGSGGQLDENFALLEGWFGGLWTDQNRWVEKRFVLEIACPGAAVGIVQTFGPSSGAVLAAGVYPITYTITDSCGNVSTCKFEVEVVPAGDGGPVCPLINHALGKTASQSSTWVGAFGSRAVDGNTEGNFWKDFSVAHTTWETNPWWQVDLGEQKDIRQVNVWGRTDCCAAETSGFYIFISEKNFALTASLNDLLADATVKKYFVAEAAAHPTTILTAGATGRFVRLQAAKATFLGLAEVEVLGCEKIAAADSPDRQLSAGQIIKTAPLPDFDFQLVPNPTADFVEVSLKKYLGRSGELVVFNQLGVQVFSLRFENLEEEKIRLSLRDLNLRNGLHFVGVRQSSVRPVFKRLVFLNED